MQEQRDKPVILGEKTTVLLWGFKVNARDRRNGNIAEGYIVVTGNEEYDTDIAREEIKKKYGRIGYDVTICEFDEERTFLFDALDTFRNAPPERDRCRCCEYYEPADESVGLIATCQLVNNDDEQIENNEEWKAVVTASENYGEGCPCFELSNHAKKAPENKPDYLAEIMATLAELEEREEKTATAGYEGVE